MSEVSKAEMQRARSSAVLPVTVAVALLAALGGLVWALVLQQRLAATETRLALAIQDRSVLGRQLRETDAKIRANSANVDEQMTRAQQQQAALTARAQAIAADTSRLQMTQAATDEKLGSVATDVNGVKTDVGTVRTDVTTTRSELAATKTDVADTKPCSPAPSAMRVS